MENNFDSAKAYYESVSEYQRNQIYNIMVGYASHISPAVTPPAGTDREELEKAYEDYIQLLTDELNEVVVMMSVHGWKSTRAEQGKKARELIKRLKDEYLQKEQKGEV
jgi:hypothetical protein